ncbi:U33-theraphotoxin-Cg1c-like [Uloborus diversus]|uniref:U33-theraphotoxin-Cg1c-like n=1 Tax=Uloborus diversus TaxID=327109 RepID=UPI00240A153D|nr:U33-theraphotoxin-Cg1c-like [Uloborus diversus]
MHSKIAFLLFVFTFYFHITSAMHCSEHDPCPGNMCCLKYNDSTMCKPLSKEKKQCEQEPASNGIYRAFCPCQMGLECEPAGVLNYCIRPPDY